MARLPSERYVIQQIDGDVILFEDYTEREIVRFDPSDANATAKAQLNIYLSDELSDEDKCFAHFWAGYFYAHTGNAEPPSTVAPANKLIFKSKNLTQPSTTPTRFDTRATDRSFENEMRMQVSGR